MKSRVAFGYLVHAGSERLPVTTIQVGSRTLSFAGRPGGRLRGAIDKLEKDEAAEAERRRLYPPPSDPRD